MPAPRRRSTPASTLALLLSALVLGRCGCVRGGSPLVGYDATPRRASPPSSHPAAASSADTNHGPGQGAAAPGVGRGGVRRSVLWALSLPHAVERKLFVLPPPWAPPPPNASNASGHAAPPAPKPQLALPFPLAPVLAAAAGNATPPGCGVSCPPASPTFTEASTTDSGAGSEYKPRGPPQAVGSVLPPPPPQPLPPSASPAPAPSPVYLPAPHAAYPPPDALAFAPPPPALVLASPPPPPPPPPPAPHPPSPPLGSPQVQMTIRVGGYTTRSFGTAQAQQLLNATSLALGGASVVFVGFGNIPPPPLPTTTPPAPSPPPSARRRLSLLGGGDAAAPSPLSLPRRAAQHHRRRVLSQLPPPPPPPAALPPPLPATLHINAAPPPPGAYVDANVAALMPNASAAAFIVTSFTMTPFQLRAAGLLTVTSVDVVAKSQPAAAASPTPAAAGASSPAAPPAPVGLPPDQSGMLVRTQPQAAPPGSTINAPDSSSLPPSPPNRTPASPPPPATATPVASTSGSAAAVVAGATVGGAIVFCALLWCGLRSSSASRLRARRSSLYSLEPRKGAPHALLRTGSFVSGGGNSPPMPMMHPPVPPSDAWRSFDASSPPPPLPPRCDGGGEGGGYARPPPLPARATSHGFSRDASPVGGAAPSSHHRLSADGVPQWSPRSPRSPTAAQRRGASLSAHVHTRRESMLAEAAASPHRHHHAPPPAPLSPRAAPVGSVVHASPPSFGQRSPHASLFWDDPPPLPLPPPPPSVRLGGAGIVEDWDGGVDSPWWVAAAAAAGEGDAADAITEAVAVKSPVHAGGTGGVQLSMGAVDALFFFERASAAASLRSLRAAGGGSFLAAAGGDDSFGRGGLNLDVTGAAGLTDTPPPGVVSDGLSPCFSSAPGSPGMIGGAVAEASSFGSQQPPRANVDVDDVFGAHHAQSLVN